MKVSLKNYGNIPPLLLAKHAASICYQSIVPEVLHNLTKKTMGFVFDKLFKVGHHTTLQHSHFTFTIEDIAVSDVTFGLHLTFPQYNSDQRSGRFAAEMYANPDYDSIRNYIKEMYCVSDPKILDQITDFIRLGLEIYRDHLDEATDLATDWLRQDRPNLSEERVAQTAPKIAQEQMRMFISTIFPTALNYTLNLSALIALWESAWTPSLRKITDMMRDALLDKFPELNCFFIEERRRQDDWSCILYPADCAMKIAGVANKWQSTTVIEDLQTNLQSKITNPDSALHHPVDRLHFTPEMMDNSISRITMSGVHMSVATMGQDQRHRTINHGTPVFTGQFYLPPLVKNLVSRQIITRHTIFFNMWLKLAENVSSSLLMAVAPYGAVVRYNKSGEINGIYHEQCKRLCWCAQEEISNIALEMREMLLKNGKENLASMFEPPCFTTGKCGEGERYCGRDLASRQESNIFFCRRRV